MTILIIVVVAIVVISIALMSENKSSGENPEVPVLSGDALKVEEHITKLQEPEVPLRLGDKFRFQVRIVETTLDGKAGGLFIKEIQTRGLVPIEETTDLGVVTSVFDSTDPFVLIPVFSYTDIAQELESPAFQQGIEFGVIMPDQVIDSWVTIASIAPEMLQPPYGGNRKLTIRTRFVDLENPPLIMLGREVSHSGIIWSEDFEFSYHFKEKGYQEIVEDREEAQALSVQIAIAVAMADGSLGGSEGRVIQDWVRKMISPFSEDKQTELKDIYNKAIRSAYTLSEAGDLSLSEITGHLNKIGEAKIKYDALELCYKVMAADGVAGPEEMKVLHQIGEGLELDVDQIESIRDQVMVDVGASISEGESIDQTLGINPTLPKDQIRARLRKEFQKWNGRLNSLPEGHERKSAQNMMDRIAEVMRKYE